MPLEPLADKFKAFNWKVAPKAYDGHDMTQIAESFAWLEEISSADGASGPYVIIYNTVKGKGVDHMENSHAWHGAPVGDDDYSKAKPQLEQRLTELEAQL
jgi:transketolase